VILQHPRESAVPIGTARLAELGLVNAERHVGVEFSNDPRVQAALQSPSAPAILLYPGPGARDLSMEPPAGPVTLVAIDGTWWQAQKIFKKNPELRALPRYSLNPEAPSRYRIRREPAPHCLSTIEALVLALSALEREPSRLRALLAPFEALVEQQLGYARNQAERRARHRIRGPTAPPIPAPFRERPGDIVVGYGEANAWPRDTPLGSHPEIVHFAAERLPSGERFEAFVAPRRPFAPFFTHHTGIARELVEGGESWSSFCARWADFLRERDVLCGWGYYASELLRIEGARVPERLDLRLAALRYLRRRPGTVEACAELFGGPVTPPWVVGRTGVRLAALSGVARGFLRRVSKVSG
jgi:DTW domain-containing protein YfiP